MELEFNQVSVYSVVKWDIWPGIVRIVGTRDDSGINLKRAFGSFVGMTGDRDVSLPVLTTTPQQEIVQYSDFNMSHIPVVILAESFGLCGTVSFFVGVISLHCQLQNTVVLLGLRRNHSQFRSNAHLETVLITKNGMKSTKVFHSSTVCSTSNRSMTVTSFRQCTQCPSPSVGVFCRVGSICGGRRQRLCAAGHWSIQISWRLHDGANM